MNAPASFKNPFFITRSSANLMEDLQRQVLIPQAICLLYGIEGSGKTRLIRQFISTRVYDRNVKFVRVVAEGFLLDEDDQVHAFDSIVATLQKSSSSHSIWVIDQLELAPDDFIRQLFELWSQPASKLNCTLILGCRSLYLTTVYRISEQYKLRIPSVELKPLSHIESLQYLSAQLCPDTDSVPVLSKELNTELKIAGGVPKLLDHIIQRHSGIIECRQQSLIKTKSKLLFTLGGLMLLVGLGLYIRISNPDLVQGLLSRQLEKVEAIQIPSSNMLQETHSEITGTVEHEVIEESAITAEEDPELVSPVNPNNTETKEIKLEHKKPQQAHLVTTEEVSETIESPTNVLQERLAATRIWLEKSSDTTTSIQIMSLAKGKDSEKSLLVFFHKQAEKGINLRQIYIYEMNKAKDHIYVILFGSYTSRNEAWSQVDSLPSSLKANSPIVRTVLGIKNEIYEGEI